MSSTEHLSVVIADDIPLDRHLLRFFLEEDGIHVVAEAARGDEAARLVAEHLPDAVILHESLTVAEGVGSIPLIRQTSPFTKIVMFSSHPEEAPRTPSSWGADVRLKERVGLKDLSLVLKALCPSPRIAIDDEEDEGRWEPERPKDAAACEPASLDEYRSKRAKPGGRRLGRLQTVVAACILFFAFMLSRSAILNPSSVVQSSAPEVAGENADGRLQAATQRLQDLLDSMRAGVTAEIPANAQALVAARAVAVAADADVSRLDTRIAASVPDLLPQLPPATATAVQAILGPLLEVTPSPAPLPELSPWPPRTPPPFPTPTETPTPTASPTETSSPSPTETPTSTPSPTETPSPSPSPTETPTPTASPTETPMPSPSPTESLAPEPTPLASPSSEVGPSAAPSPGRKKGPPSASVDAPKATSAEGPPRDASTPGVRANVLIGSRYGV